jgi:short-subunit dehydrogenase
VLGIGPGIGGAVAKKWAQNGYSVACVARSAEKGEQLAKEIGNGSIGYACDVSDEVQLAQLVGRIETEMGEIEALIYNAGSGVFKNYEEISHEEFRRSWEVNTFGLLAAAKLICPKMAARGRGVVAVTGATASLRGRPATAGFAASKAAQRSLAQSLARDLGPKASSHQFPPTHRESCRPKRATGRSHSLLSQLVVSPGHVSLGSHEKLRRSAPAKSSRLWHGHIPSAYQPGSERSNEQASGRSVL